MHAMASTAHSFNASTRLFNTCHLASHRFKPQITTKDEVKNMKSHVPPQLVASDAPTAALFRTGRIGQMELRNRFVQAPIYTQFASTFGEVTDKLIEYHRARARGGVGLIITENTSIDWEVGRTTGHPIRIDHDRFIGGLSNQCRSWAPACRVPIWPHEWVSPMPSPPTSHRKCCCLHWRITAKTSVPPLT